MKKQYQIEKQRAVQQFRRIATEQITLCCGRSRFRCEAATPSETVQKCRARITLTSIGGRSQMRRVNLGLLNVKSACIKIEGPDRRKGDGGVLSALLCGAVFLPTGEKYYRARHQKRQNQYPSL